MSSSKELPVKASKKSSFSCDQCRRRKVKCGGEQPSCDRCITRNENCLYKLTPTISYTQKLENRVEELEHLLRQIQHHPDAETTSSPQTITQTSPQDVASNIEPDKSKLLGTFGGLAFDKRGGITYHGATSLFQLPSVPTAEESSGSSEVTSKHSQDGDSRREILVSNAWHQRAMEVFSEIPEPFQFMLKTHWCWIQPLFNFIYRPAFTRDMETLGPYYSHTLLNAMLSHSVRWCTNNAHVNELLQQYGGGESFSRQARVLLFQELEQGHCTVPTVQTLLLLSAQECSYGNRTQAWLYSGMAFRLIEDMGICIDGQKYAGSVRLSDEDIEIRHRLFWSCYFWDKMISLYLGRSPTLQNSTVSPPQLMLDDSSEDELWTPHGLAHPHNLQYPPMKAHSTSCFMRMCQLSEIFNQILVHIYDPMQQNSYDEIEACLKNQGEALHLWWEDLPDFLRIDSKKLPLYSPPSHIVTMNSLYHTFRILLYRPMLCQRPTIAESRRPDPNHLVECIASATSIIAIFDLFCRTFGDSFCILSLSYSVYTAASIFLLQVQAAAFFDEQTFDRLMFCINALERVKTSNKVIGSSLDLIIQALSELGFGLPPQATIEVATTEANPPADSSTPQRTFSLPPDSTCSTTPESSDVPHVPALYEFNPEGFEVSNEMLQALSSLRPVDPTVGIQEPWDGDLNP